MTGSYESMKTKLDAVGVYNITEGSNVSNELTSYAEGLDTLFSGLDEMTKEYFIETAESYGVARRERFLGKERSEYTLDKRREMLTLQEQDIGGKCTPEAFEAVMKSYGISDFSFTELPITNRLVIAVYDTLTPEIKKMVSERIALDFPQHLNIVVNFADE